MHLSWIEILRERVLGPRSVPEVGPVRYILGVVSTQPSPDTLFKAAISSQSTLALKGLASWSYTYVGGRPDDYLTFTHTIKLPHSEPLTSNSRILALWHLWTCRKSAIDLSSLSSTSSLFLLIHPTPVTRLNNLHDSQRF